MESGTRLAHYRIADLIGKGGMGEVFRAHDTKLGRDVALKVLPGEFASDRDRMARFEREAQLPSMVGPSCTGRWIWPIRQRLQR